MATDGPKGADAKHDHPAQAERRASGAITAEPSRAPAGGVEATLLRLQGAAGNRATAQFLAGAQTKLIVGPTGDVFEREADDVAGRVVAAMFSGTSPGTVPGTAAATPVQRRRASGAASSAGHRSPAPDAARNAQVGAAGGEVDTETASRIAAARSGGETMDTEARSGFEAAMGADFSDVRLHGGGAADELNRQLGARAFTVGRDVFFGGGVPDPGSREGASLLAHELTHVVQQGGAGVQRSPVEHVQRAGPTTASDTSTSNTNTNTTTTTNTTNTTPTPPPPPPTPPPAPPPTPPPPPAPATPC